MVVDGFKARTPLDKEMGSDTAGRRPASPWVVSSAVVVVSARTNKNHHHHRYTGELCQGMVVDLGVFGFEC
jgi:hypothetical protein